MAQEGRNEEGKEDSWRLMMNDGSMAVETGEWFQIHGRNSDEAVIVT